MLQKFFLTIVISTLPFYLLAAPPVSEGVAPYRKRVARQLPSVRQNLSPRAQSVGQINLAPRGLLILAQFTDMTFEAGNTQADFDSLANAVHYTYNKALGSARAYFREQSLGQYEPVFDVVGPVNLPHTYAYYGTNDASGYDRYTADFVMDAVAAADSAGVDFSQYDNDEDGVIDFVYIIYAGMGEADGGASTTIWPHNWDLMSNFYYHYTNQTTYYYKSEQDYLLPQYDGKYLNDYACSGELRSTGDRTAIGVICHEFSHVLGLPDYYLTTQSPTMSLSNTPGAWSLMGYGCYLANGNAPCNFSAYDKYTFQWVQPTVLSGSQQVVIPADGATYFMVTRDGQIPANGAMTEDTVYYIENRQYSGWDLYLPGHGMLVWRVVYDTEQWQDNTPNDYSIRISPLTADGSTPYSTDKWGKAKEGVPFPGSKQVSSLTLFHYTLADIQEQYDGSISFHFIDPATPTSDVTLLQDVTVIKQWQHGSMTIRRNGVTYDMLGRKLK